MKSIRTALSASHAWLAPRPVISLIGSGTIPARLGNLANLEELYLNENQLTGCVPLGLQGVEIIDFTDLGLPFCTN